MIFRNVTFFPILSFWKLSLFPRVKQKFYLNVAKYYDHICASVGNRKKFHEWVKLRSVDLEIVGGGYITHLPDFGGFKSSSQGKCKLYPIHFF